MSFQRGDKVTGRYRLIEVIGTGGMGRVWRAHDDLLDRQVAVKEIVLPDDLSLDEKRAAQQLTVREARTAARLDHPNVVRVFDVVWTPGRSWIVMEHVPSRSLHEVIEQDGPLSHPEAARMGLMVLGALRAAHAAGVLHHDVKPQNVLITDDGQAVLTDFGLATMGGAPAGDGSGLLVGSPRFIAPERAEHLMSSERTDLWSLGATLYAAVEGRPPFDRATTAETLTALRTSAPDPPRHPGPLHPVIAGLLDRDTARRWTAEQAQNGLLRLLRPAIGTSAVPQPRRPVEDAVRFERASVPVVVPRPRPASEPLPPQPAARRRLPGRRVLIGLAVVAGLAGTGAAVAAGRDHRPAPVSPAAVTSPVVGECPPDTGRPVAAGASAAPIALPDGWLWHTDPAGFALPVPSGWTRTAAGARVCFTDPDGLRSFTVATGRAGTGDPLREWQSTERTVLSGTALPGYRRVSMGVLLVSGGGADWEYSWEPAGGPRLHTHRVLLAATGKRPFRLTWTTREQDWALSRAAERTFLDGFRDRVTSASPWAVPSP